LTPEAANALVVLYAAHGILPLGDAAEGAEDERRTDTG